MASVQGFRCGQCRGELLVAKEPVDRVGRRGWAPPVLCCGQSLRALEPDQSMIGVMGRRRIAGCPRCGYRVRLIVHPAGPLVCMLCQTDFVNLGGKPDLLEPGETLVGATPNASP